MGTGMSNPESNCPVWLQAVTFTRDQVDTLELVLFTTLIISLLPLVKCVLQIEKRIV